MAELGEVLSNLEKSVPTQRELGDIMEELDSNASGGVNSGEFLQFMTRDREEGR